MDLKLSISDLDLDSNCRVTTDPDSDPEPTTCYYGSRFESYLQGRFRSGS